MGSISKNLNLIVFIAVLPAMAIILVFGLHQRQHSIKEAQREVLSLAKTMAEVQRGITNSTRQIFSTLSHVPEIRNGNSIVSSKILRAVTEENPDYINILVLDIEGQVLSSGLPFNEGNLSDRKHFREAIASRDFAVGEYVVTRISGKRPALTFAYPILDDENEPRLVLSTALRLERFAHFFDVATLPKNSFITVTDHQGIRLFLYPPREETNPIGQKIHPQGWEACGGKQEPGISVHRGSDGVRRIFAYQPVQLRPGDPPYMYMWASIPEAEAIESANRALAGNLAFMFLAALAALSTSWLIGRRTLIRPIKHLVGTARDFANGNLNARTKLDDTHGEIKELAQAFDNMVAEMARQQETLHTIADFTYDWEYWLDPDGNPLWVSLSCERISGYTAHEFMADPFLMRRLVHEEDVPLFNQHLRDTIECPNCPLHLDFRIIHRSGHVVWIDHHCMPIFSKDGMPLGRRVSNRDITERKKVEDERTKLEIQLQEAQKMEAVGRLAGGVAHDFNNMLGVILGHAELTMMNLDPSDSLHSSLNEIKKAAEHSAELTNQLLAFARKQATAPRVLNVNESIEGMLKMLRRLIGENIDLIWKPGTDLSPIKMDPTQLTQVLANLCVNARDAICGTGKITIGTQSLEFEKPFFSSGADGTPNDHILLTVSDDGCGMDEEILAHIFEPFFTTKERGKGTGLGLSTVYGIVKQNNGCIHVQSQPDKGTTFQVYLPRHAGNLTDVQPGKLSEQRSSGSETILLVEDEAPFLGMARAMLQNLGYRVLAAETPVGALHLAANNSGKIDLLLTDVIMPGMNGKELLEKISAIHPGIKCLFMSGYTADVIAQEGTLDEGVDFIQKPFQTQDLAACLDRALGRK